MVRTAAVPWHAFHARSTFFGRRLLRLLCCRGVQVIVGFLDGMLGRHVVVGATYSFEVPARALWKPAGVLALPLRSNVVSDTTQHMVCLGNVQNVGCLFQGLEVFLAFLQSLDTPLPWLD